MIRIINEVNFDKFDDYDLGSSWDDDVYEQFAIFVQKDHPEDAEYQILDKQGGEIKVKLPRAYGENAYGNYLLWPEDRVCADVADFLSAYKKNIKDISLEYYAKSTNPIMQDIVNAENTDKETKYRLITEHIIDTLKYYSEDTPKEIKENWESYFCFLFFGANWCYFKTIDNVRYYWN